MKSKCGRKLAPPSAWNCTGVPDVGYLFIWAGLPVARIRCSFASLAEP
jgi:hypothetical protein